jgi:hypothetical protein
MVVWRVDELVAHGGERVGTPPLMGGLRASREAAYLGFRAWGWPGPKGRGSTQVRANSGEF